MTIVLVAMTHPRPELSGRIVDGEVVVLDHQNERIHQLNATASFVWTRLGGTVDLPAIAAELTQHFEVAEERALVDVQRIVQEFMELELVTPCDEHGSGERG